MVDGRRVEVTRMVAVAFEPSLFEPKSPLPGNGIFYDAFLQWSDTIVRGHRRRRKIAREHSGATIPLMLVAFNLRAIATGDPLVAMLVTSVMFGYGAGIVGQLGARPGRARGRLSGL